MDWPGYISLHGHILGNTLMKRCSKCKIEKNQSDFGKDCTRKDGLKSQCKTCVAKYNQGYRATHKEEIAEQHRSPAGKAVNRKSGKKYYQKNRTEILEKQRSPAGRATQSKANKKRREKFPERIKAKDAVNNAIAAGKLERPSICEACSEEKFVEGHHESYKEEDWLKVNWLCKKCHVELHKNSSGKSTE